MNSSDPYISYWWLAPKYFEQLRARPLYLVVEESAVFLALNAVTFCGNLLVCLVFCTKRTLLRSSTNLLMLSLTATDLLSAVFVMPWTVYILVNRKWIKPVNPVDVKEFVCRFQAVIGLILIGCSLHMMAITAANRYLCVVKQKWFKEIFTKDGTLLLIAAEWFFASALMTISPATGLARITLNPRRAGCFSTLADPGLVKVSSYVLSVLFFGVPMCVMAFCYFSIFRFVKRKSFQVAVQTDADSRPLGKRIKEVKITKTFFTVMLGFLICWVPVVITDILSLNLTDPRYPRQGELVYTYFTFLSSAINPFIYGATNRSLRKKFLVVIKLRKTKSVSE